MGDAAPRPRCAKHFTHWGLPGDARGEEAVMGHPEDRDHWGRLIQVDGVSHQPIRGSSQPLDTGKVPKKVAIMHALPDGFGMMDLV